MNDWQNEYDAEKNLIQIGVMDPDYTYSNKDGVNTYAIVTRGELALFLSRAMAKMETIWKIKR